MAREVGLLDDFLRKMGARILMRRKELELTQERVAEQAGLTIQTVSSAERGVKALRPENIVRISEALQVTPDYLLLGVGVRDSLETLSDKIDRLTPQQRYYLEKIVESYILGVSVTE